jgi:type I restriction enzyme M protein
MAKSINERKTENIVRKLLLERGFFDDGSIIVEEQQSDWPMIKKALNLASKSGSGAGYPEFIIRSKEKTDLLIVIECKGDVNKHESLTKNRYADYAVDGSILYGSYLSKIYDVISIGVSGQTESELKITHHIFIKGDNTYDEFAGDKILSFDNYYKLLTENNKKFNTDYAKLLEFTKDLNKTLHSNKIKESQRSLLISGILIALQNDAFIKSFKSHKTASQLAGTLVKTIVDELSSSSIPEAKIDTLTTAFGFIKTNSSLANNKEFLETLVETIETRIHSFIKTYQYLDIIGQFYIEFLRYANNDKGLGIVLTPPHITELFVELSGVNENSVIIDNCCGTGGFLISSLNKMIRSAKGDDVKIKSIKSSQLVGVEFQDDIYALAVSNMIIHGDGKSNIFNKSCFEVTDRIKKEYKPTIGLLNPPYKSEVTDKEEFEFVLNNLDMLQTNGICIALIPITCVIEKLPRKTC